jgi:hypothetical protein
MTVDGSFKGNYMKKLMILAVAVLGIVGSQVQTAKAGERGFGVSVYASPPPVYLFPPPFLYPPRIVIRPPFLGFHFGFGDRHFDDYRRYDNHRHYRGRW